MLRETLALTGLLAADLLHAAACALIDRIGDRGYGGDTRWFFWSDGGGSGGSDWSGGGGGFDGGGGGSDW